MMCEVRLTDDKSPWLEGTKCILLLGEYALHTLVPESRNNTLNELRGSVFYISGIPVIASFFPQDAADNRAYEQNLNPLSKDFKEGEEYDDDSDENSGELKSYSKTKRSNYAFWLREDAKKCKTILQSGVPQTKIFPVYKTYPTSDEIISVLSKTKDQWLFFDIETDREEHNIQCFSFSFDGQTIYNVPVLNYEYKPAYSSLAHIFCALAVAIRDNILVAHNGANFDFFVLGYKYNIPVRRVYDTMIAHHRAWPDIEKSLGHCVSHLTWERFHKDENSENYMTQEQMMTRLKYCGKDVYTMYLVKQAIDNYARTIPGLTSSITTANSHCVPYLTTTLQGIKYNQEKVTALLKENDRLMMQYLRMIELLIGESGINDIRRVIKGKARAFPNSNKQCITYFHELLGYPVTARSQKTGEASLGKKAMFKLALKHENPVIQLVLAYRILAKESGALKFLPWRNDNNTIVKWQDYERSKITEQQQSISS